MKRRANLANCLATENNLDILCLTETWLTDVQNESLLLKDYTIHKKDRKTIDNISKDRGVLEAVKNIPHERIDMQWENEYVAIKVKPKDVSIMLFCLYNPPKNSPNRWTEESINYLVQNPGLCQ